MTSSSGLSERGEQLVQWLRTELHLDAQQLVTREVPLKELGVDSMRLLELITSFEDTFDLQVADDQYSRIVVVGDLMTLAAAG